MGYLSLFSQIISKLDRNIFFKNCKRKEHHTNLKIFFSGGNTKTKMRSIYLNVAKAKK
jgi:hypothetical protein